MAQLLPYKARVKELWLNGKLLPPNPITPWDITHLLKCGDNELKIVYYGKYQWTDLSIVPMLPVNFNFFAFNKIIRVNGECWQPASVEDWLNWEKGGSRGILKSDDVSFSTNTVVSRDGEFDCKKPTNELKQSLPDVTAIPPNPLLNQKFVVEFSKPVEAKTYVATLLLVNPIQYSKGTVIRKKIGQGNALDRTKVSFTLPIDCNLEWRVVVDFDSGPSAATTVMNYGTFFADGEFKNLSGSVGSGVGCADNTTTPSDMGECIPVYDLKDGSLFNTCKECTAQNVFEADYIVFRYKFTSGDGRDLDTRTSLTDPEQGSIVGWCKGSDFYGSNAKLWYKWAGDNTGYGYEAVLVYVNNIREVYPAADIKGTNAAFWYGELGAGNVYLELTAYKGGEMVQDGYDWANVGGEITGHLTNTVNVSQNISQCVDGTHIAGWTYTKDGYFAWEGQQAGGGESSATVTIPNPPVLEFSTPTSSGTSNALVLQIVGAQSDGASGEYLAEVTESGQRTGVWRNTSDPALGIIASGNTTEVVDYAESKVLYSKTNSANSDPTAANLGVYQNVTGTAEKVVVTDVRP